MPRGIKGRDPWKDMMWKAKASARTGEEKGNGIKRKVRLENEMSPEYIRESVSYTHLTLPTILRV